MRRELFIYWKVAAAEVAAARMAAAQMQRTLQHDHLGLQARLYQRDLTRDGPQTLMESYAHAAGVGIELQAAIEAAAAVHLQAWREQLRHVEAFVALSD